MLSGKFSDLVESINRSVIPKWLREYCDTHGNEMRFDLELFGEHVIHAPTGQTISIRKKR